MTDNRTIPAEPLAPHGPIERFRLALQTAGVSTDPAGVVVKDPEDGTTFFLRLDVWPPRCDEEPFPFFDGYEHVAAYPGGKRTLIHSSYPTSEDGETESVLAGHFRSGLESPWQSCGSLPGPSLSFDGEGLTSSTTDGFHRHVPVRWNGQGWLPEGYRDHVPHWAPVTGGDRWFDVGGGVAVVGMRLFGRPGPLLAVYFEHLGEVAWVDAATLGIEHYSASFGASIGWNAEERVVTVLIPEREHEEGLTVVRAPLTWLETLPREKAAPVPRPVAEPQGQLEAPRPDGTESGLRFVTASPQRYDEPEPSTSTWGVEEAKREVQSLFAGTLVYLSLSSNSDGSRVQATAGTAPWSGPALEWHRLEGGVHRVSVAHRAKGTALSEAHVLAALTAFAETRRARTESDGIDWVELDARELERRGLRAEALPLPAVWPDQPQGRRAPIEACRTRCERVVLPVADEGYWRDSEGRLVSPHATGEVRFLRLDVWPPVEVGEPYPEGADGEELHALRGGAGSAVVPDGDVELGFVRTGYDAPWQACGDLGHGSLEVFAGQVLLHARTEGSVEEWTGSEWRVLEAGVPDDDETYQHPEVPVLGRRGHAPVEVWPGAFAIERRDAEWEEPLFVVWYRDSDEYSEVFAEDIGATPFVSPRAKLEVIAGAESLSYSTTDGEKAVARRGLQVVRIPREALEALPRLSCAQE